MRLGKIIKILVVYNFVNLSFLSADDRISSTPLLNLNEIKPSFEEQDDKSENIISNKVLKDRNLKKSEKLTPYVMLIGLDKITAKSKKFMVNINEIKKYGPLEIKILKCAKVKVNNKIDDVAYMQVKDLTKNQNEKVFIFNGWTFSSDPSLSPFDHAIYDLQLINCFNT